MSDSAPWTPQYRITSTVADALVRIGEAQGAIDHRVWSPVVEEAIRQRARVRSTHYSTAIEGNRLALEEAERVVATPASERRVTFAGRERDVKEVDHYWHALLQIEDRAKRHTPITEDLIRRLHAIVERGPGRRPTAYRTSQNVVRDSGSGAIEYLPPEPGDVRKLMAALVAYLHEAERAGVPAPIIAGLAHYQFETIHPFLDGNGRTGRLLATLLLHRGGLGLRGFFSLEEYHARDLAAYYGHLQGDLHHNYYYGRANADLTCWLEYFVPGVAHVFTVAKEEALRFAERGVPAEPDTVRKLDARARRVLALFAERREIAAADVERLFPVGARMVRRMLARWVDEGFLEVTDPSRKNRRYGLTRGYRQYMATIAGPPHTLRSS